MTEVKKAILNLLVNLPIVAFIELISNLDIANSPIPKLIPKSVKVRAKVDILFANCTPVSNQNLFVLKLEFFNLKIQNIDPNVKINKVITKDKPKIEIDQVTSSFGWLPVIITYAPSTKTVMPRNKLSTWDMLSILFLI